MSQNDAIKAPETNIPAEEGDSLAKLSERYEKELLDFVTYNLKRGVREQDLVDELRKHDFSGLEARNLVRALAKSLPPVGAVASESTASTQPNRSAGGRQAAILAEVEAGQREMAFGAMWFFGGIIASIATIAARVGAGGILFYGAVIWGGIQFFRGANRHAAAKRMLREEEA